MPCFGVVWACALTVVVLLCLLFDLPLRWLRWRVWRERFAYRLFAQNCHV